MAQGADFRSRITLDGADAVIGDLKKIGAEGDKAFAATGRAADTASSSVTGFGRAADAAARSMASLQSQGQAIGRGFADLHQHATNFGSALGNVANNIVPRFKEILGIAAVGGVAGFFALFEATAKWGHELEENAKMLGLTPSQFGQIGKAAKLAGVDIDTMTVALVRFNTELEKTRDERRKAFGEIAKDVLGASSTLGIGGVQEMRGGRTGPDPDAMRRIFSVPDIKGFRDQAEEIYAVLRKTNAIGQDVSLQRWMFGIEKVLGAGGEAAAKLRKELNQLGADLPSKTLGEQIEKSMPGFRDLFAQLKIPLFDKATGDARGFLDVFGQFLDKFKGLSVAEQGRIVLEKFGRQGRDLIPIMQKGSDGLLEFVKKAKELGIDTSAFDKEIEALSGADRAIRRMDASITGLRKSLVVPFADVFTPIFDELSAKLDENQGKVKTWAQGVATQAKEVVLDVIGVLRGADPKTEFGSMVLLGLNAITVAIGAVRLAFEGLTKVFEPLTAGLNAIFGANYTAQTYALAAAFLYFSGILPAVAAGIRLVTAALAFFLANPVGLVLTSLALIALTIYQNWDTLGPLFQKLWDLLKAFGGWLADQWVKFWTDPIQGIKDQWNAVFDWLGQKAAQAKALLQSLIPGGSPATGQAIPTPSGFASGGHVPGRGSGDIVPAMLSPGEFVIRRSVVDQLGAGFFAALNGGMGSLIPRGRYATGGLVMDGGGAGGTPVHLHLDGQSYSMRADNDVADSLLRAARAKQMLSAGRKPGWAGGRRYGG